MDEDFNHIVGDLLTISYSLPVCQAIDETFPNAYAVQYVIYRVLKERDNARINARPGPPGHHVTTATLNLHHARTNISPENRARMPNETRISAVVYT
jgi:hypothetical protein